MALQDRRLALELQLADALRLLQPAQPGRPPSQETAAAIALHARDLTCEIRAINHALGDHDRYVPATPAPPLAARNARPTTASNDNNQDRPEVQAGGSTASGLHGGRATGPEPDRTQRNQTGARDASWTDLLLVIRHTINTIWNAVSSFLTPPPPPPPPPPAPAPAPKPPPTTWLSLHPLTTAGIPLTPGPCIACATPTAPQVYTPTCGHGYCGPCSTRNARAALRDRSLIPLRCCNVELPHAVVEASLTAPEMAKYDRFWGEIQAWREAKVGGKGKTDDSDEAMERVMREKVWKRCPRCRVVVERSPGKPAPAPSSPTPSSNSFSVSPPRAGVAPAVARQNRLDAEFMRRQNAEQREHRHTWRRSSTSLAATIMTGSPRDPSSTDAIEPVDFLDLIFPPPPPSDANSAVESQPQPQPQPEGKRSWADMADDELSDVEGPEESDEEVDEDEDDEGELSDTEGSEDRDFVRNLMACRRGSNLQAKPAVYLALERSTGQKGRESLAKVALPPTHAVSSTNPTNPPAPTAIATPPPPPIIIADESSLLASGPPYFFNPTAWYPLRFHNAVLEAEFLRFCHRRRDRFKRERAERVERAREADREAAMIADVDEMSRCMPVAGRRRGKGERMSRAPRMTVSVVDPRRVEALERARMEEARFRERGRRAEPVGWGGTAKSVAAPRAMDDGRNSRIPSNGEAGSQRNHAAGDRDGAAKWQNNSFVRTPAAKPQPPTSGNPKTGPINQPPSTTGRDDAGRLVSNPTVKSARDLATAQMPQNMSSNASKWKGPANQPASTTSRTDVGSKPTPKTVCMPAKPKSWVETAKLSATPANRKATPASWANTLKASTKNMAANEVASAVEADEWVTVQKRKK
ncbi:hypothetical protein HDU96_007350 [Phlyctochytrium bullatum]|nr:hypothetical protein HDU96_007350 [Phlyctochytrium bullatum]